MALIWLALAACGLGAGRIDEAPVAAYRGANFAVAIPAGAKVVAKDSHLQVDAADGSRWFDVRWHDGVHAPMVLAINWADAICRPTQWDQPVEPHPGVWTVGGICNIDGRRHWALAVVETRGERKLFTGYVAAFSKLAYEDVWVDVIRTALTVQAGTDAAPTLDASAIRERVRQVEPTPSEAALPKPGGGTFSMKLSRAFADVWQARMKASMPPSFDAVAISPGDGPTPADAPAP